MCVNTKHCRIVQKGSHTLENLDFQSSSLLLSLLLLLPLPLTLLLFLVLWLLLLLLPLFHFIVAAVATFIRFVDRLTVVDAHSYFISLSRSLALFGFFFFYFIFCVLQLCTWMTDFYTECAKFEWIDRILYVCMVCVLHVHWHTRTLSHSQYMHVWNCTGESPSKRWLYHFNIVFTSILLILGRVDNSIV